MSADAPGSISVGGDVGKSVLVTGSQNIILQAEQVLFQAAQAARQEGLDPAHALRILAILAAPVYDPRRPEYLPPPLDLKQEWHELSQAVRESRAPILLVRVVPPTLDFLRRALSPRAEAQAFFPHILHFSGHAWSGGLLLEDELNRVHPATTDEVLDALKGLPRPLDLVVLNGCESAAGARSVAQALVERGLARAAVGHTQSVYDPEAVRFAARLYAELSDGFPLKEAVERAQRAVTTHEVLLLGDEGLRFEGFTGGGPWIDDRRPPGNLPARPGFFFGRGSRLVEIAKALAHPPRVVVFSGPAAIGKTSLALEAAHRNGWRFSGGVAFAEGPRPEEGRPGTADDLFNRLAEALGIRPEVGRVAEALRLYTDRRPTLLVLDSLEGLPQLELDRLRRFLSHLGGESAALVLARSPLGLLEALPSACFLPLHEGIGSEAAVRYALRLAEERGIPLGPTKAEEMVRAVDGHPRLVELLVAQARQRDLAVLLREVRERRGDFRRQLELVYDWSVGLLEERGQLGAWQALDLFPAGRAPEGLLRAAAGEEGVEALREAALADFDPARQFWRWHATVGEYARIHWPLDEGERCARLAALLPVWTEWLAGLPPETPERVFRIEAQEANLGLLLEQAAHLPGEALRAWLRGLQRVLPEPDRTLSLRAFEERLYRVWAEGAREQEERAQVLGMLGYALAALGRREEALAAAQEAADLYRELAQARPEAFLPDLAMSLNNLGAMLSDLGRREEALTATEEAVKIRRQLAQAHPEAFLPDLAGSLNNLGKMLSELGRREEALTATEEAVGIYRPLAQVHPEAFLPDLAMSLNNLGIWLSALGRREEALTATEEAVKIRRQLAQAHPEAFLPDLARSLNNLGNILSALGRREEALKAAEEAVGIYRPLAQDNPQAFLPDLAMSLHNLGNRLSALGRREEALTATEEAVGIYRPLAQVYPEAFLPDLAMSLHNLGAMLYALGRREEALTATEEAVGIYRQLAQAHPPAFLPYLAGSLSNLGAMLSALGRREEALKAAEEAVGIYRPLAQDNPEAFLPYLASSLNNLGSDLSALGRREEALAAAQEAADLYRELAQVHPEAFLPYLAASLANLGAMLSALGRREEALTATEEAVKIRRQLAQAHPAAFLPDLAMSLNNLGSDLSAMGRREEALAAAQEAADLYRELAQVHPQAFLPDLAMSLHNLGNRLSALGRREEALTATEEAVGIYRPLAQAHPEAFLPALARSLHNLGAMLAELGRREEALAASQEAADLYRELAQVHPEAFLPDLAMSLNNLGNRLSALGRREEALKAAEEAVKIRRRLAQANPEAFLPDLAMSLNNLGSDLSALGRREEALTAYEEGLRALTPFFLRFPAAFANWMDTIVRNYLKECEALGREPGDWYFYQRGLAYRLSGREEEAGQDFAAAIVQAEETHRENPGDWRTTFNLALYHIAAGNPARAESLYRQAAEGAPLGLIRMAVQDLDDFLYLFPNHPHAAKMRRFLQDGLAQREGGA